MFLEFLFNPWVIIIIVVSVVAGNIAALKYTANMKVGTMSKTQKDDIDRLKQLDEERQKQSKQQANEKSPDEPDDLK
ncbi:hypothetical protein A9264_05200 [Vibrio sp. UCD-FRSSP16_10]|uniref:DUF2897 family protein n=1 Tax=unclassified Vibrio TaxID=2614977 RepID=UPI0008008610|nr:MULTISPECIES: DUF2897 family protein [unclassified Vibrio]OBT08634.1 hypothetical protein A9260_07440 [Vibrio sp. UCD-FRSSP16_30]OBT18164.1 hypothetical protein A9264_05200 [Vibrio sp. UCD-FRSSP16_10]